METRQQYVIEESCHELQAYIERLDNLNEKDEKDMRTYFSRNNIWVDNLETLGYRIGNGAEAYIYKGYDGKEVFKLKRGGVNIKGIVNVLKNSLNHNKVFPETFYSLIGFSSYGKDTSGTTVYGAILRQEFVEGEFATNEQIRTHLKKDGYTIFQQGETEDHILCLKNGFQVTDVKTNNAIVANEKVNIIDCCIVKYE